MADPGVLHKARFTGTIHDDVGTKPLNGELAFGIGLL
jgi:hypothetical protein